MPTIRVLNVVAIMNRGGLETMIMNHYRKINREKIQFDFLVHRIEKGAFDDEIRKMGGKIYYLPKFNPLKINQYNNALKLFFNEHPNYKIIHSHYNALSMWPLRAAMEYKIPVRIAHSHLAYPKLNYQTPFYLYARYRINEYCTHRFACSENAARWLFGEEEVSNSIIFKNSISIEEFKYNVSVRDDYRSKLNLNGKFVIGHVGRFNSSKNHLFLLEIFKEIYTIKPNSVLLLVGDGELKDRIVSKANQLKILDAVIFLGVRSDVSKLLQAIDVFVFPSLFEALPVTLIEAQTAGVKVFASDTITNEVKVTKLIDFISLKKNPAFWADYILSNTEDHERSDKSLQIERNGYDINQNVNWLEEFYLGEYDKHNHTITD
jgi:glycosyltransferase involved in cell wall biosynthesis